MDSIQLQPQAATKLPIKRKTPQLEFEPVLLIPSSALKPTPPPLPQPQPQPPPLMKKKFHHRIWTEPDEIAFLESLLLSSGSPHHTHSLPFTKSQLSHKLRRLRNKFRLHRGLPLSSLSPHDRALFHLSKRLWSPNSDIIDGGVVLKCALDVFDQCFKQARKGMMASMATMAMGMESKWKEQRVSELDVLGRRLRLLIHDSLTLTTTTPNQAMPCHAHDI